jgi:hypothetical protein
MTTITSEESYSKGVLSSPNGNFEWEGHSDGNKGTLKVTIDGKETKIINFTKNELENLFNQSVEKIKLDKKLMMDFMSNDENYINPFKNTQSKSKVKNKNKNTHRKKNKKSMKSMKSTKKIKNKI